MPPNNPCSEVRMTPLRARRTGTWTGAIRTSTQSNSFEFIQAAGQLHKYTKGVIQDLCCVKSHDGFAPNVRMHSPPQTQTGIVVGSQNAPTSASSSLPLSISDLLPVPDLPSPNHVLVRVLAVALNPTDFKMVSHFSRAGNMVGCDFMGVVEEKSPASGNPPPIPVGTRVCGAVFPYNPQDPYNGSFAQWVVSDARLLLRVPEEWDDLQAAALGGVGWGTAGLAFYDPEALALKGQPSKPIEKKEPVLVYGGATASGTMACQMLKLSGYSPIAVTSTKSATLARSFGAAGTAAYTSPTCAEDIKSLAGAPIRLALDCITSSESVATCFAAMARTGGRYACLEGLEDSWRTRRTIKTRVVMGFEGLGIPIDLGPTEYSRGANQQLFEVTARWTEEMQFALNAGGVKVHPVREVSGVWQGIIDGLQMIQRGEIRGQKLVVRVASA